MRLRLARRRFDLRLRRLRAAIADVVGDRAVQQRGVLRDQPDLGAYAFLGDVPDILPVDGDAPVFDVEKAQQQVDQRRLAGAGAADQTDAFAGTHDQVDVVEDRFVEIGFAERICQFGLPVP